MWALNLPITSLSSIANVVGLLISMTGKYSIGEAGNSNIKIIITHDFSFLYPSVLSIDNRAIKDLLLHFSVSYNSYLSFIWWQLCADTGKIKNLVVKTNLYTAYLIVNSGNFRGSLFLYRCFGYHSDPVSETYVCNIPSTVHYNSVIKSSMDLINDLIYGPRFINPGSLTNYCYMRELCTNTWPSLAALRATRWTQGGSSRNWPRVTMVTNHIISVKADFYRTF